MNDHPSPKPLAEGTHRIGTYTMDNGEQLWFTREDGEWVPYALTQGGNLIAPPPCFQPTPEVIEGIRPTQVLVVPKPDEDEDEDEGDFEDIEPPDATEQAEALEARGIYPYRR